MFLKKLDEQLTIALEQEGFEKPTPIQKKSIGRMKSGHDCLFIAPEQSGKTTAIVITVIQQLKEAFEDVPRALIVVEDRAKAEAMKAQFDILTEDTGLRVTAVFQGEHMLKQRDRVYAGCDVLIGPAKFLNELYSNSGMNLNGLKMYIIDDGYDVFKHEITSQIDRLTTSTPETQRIVFTTKMNVRINDYVEYYMIAPEVVEIKEEPSEEEVQ
ncbi:DEAD/DEAH box helicase [Ancylomarina sp. 16SWW S1-10-2]|uniref:DEAD/DEAH box helicase n=1 Tax=Ancylomarina sp. 16SWW S1-10-2 TaxID=2499681 RepID=UPI0012AD44C2|nr:DEAD/DEAH box helicase [Ancylomarina sp. 16SWW S1-10-2]MRT92143.1 DEAD/DEAH box helicase [Ancylomarina sp. 16SWW S1-10-2]